MCVYILVPEGLISVSQQQVELQLIWFIAEISYDTRHLTVLVALIINLVLL